MTEPTQQQQDDPPPGMWVPSGGRRSPPFLTPDGGIMPNRIYHAPQEAT